ncbi:hypothetical protein DAPPUDRAFT_319088 [Daphnia pulex]|uniref:DUF4806 domain-containing protein n=1 Tax=Daphnia pulex TaxID=6669 RepID=E9GKM4_DAPPU|nr:hypothetical protein DAPPUDRAFT_319088 [Daphnia pulex]|eukprot:EFX80036.1 hypothetical protein DAPPUDRAFT_319088 [Daphnia pulex]
MGPSRPILTFIERTNSVVTERDFFPFPVDDEKNFALFLVLLESPEDVAKLMTGRLSSLGGKNLDDRICNIWAAIVTDKWGMSLSWAGCDASKYAVKNTKLFHFIYDLVRSSIFYTNAEQSAVEETSKNWIYKAGRRYLRAQPTAGKRTRLDDEEDPREGMSSAEIGASNGYYEKEMDLEDGKQEYQIGCHLTFFPVSHLAQGTKYRISLELARTTVCDPKLKPGIATYASILLTLLPKSWNRSKIMKEMSCSEFLAKEAIRLRNDGKILPKLKSKDSGKKLSEVDVSTIIKFYEENSKTSLGMKDVIMMANNFPSHRCTDCPDPSVLSEFLRSKLQEEEITYSEWVSEEGQTLMKKVIDQADVFVETLTLKLQQLCRHHYISDKQGKFFKQLKENLKEEECLILLDFAENYSLMIQDEVQSHHWSCQQATLHNVVTYVKKCQAAFLSEYANLIKPRLIGSAIVENILEAVMSDESKVEFAYKKAHHGQVFYFHKLNLYDVVKEAIFEWCLAVTKAQADKVFSKWFRQLK